MIPYRVRMVLVFIYLCFLFSSCLKVKENLRIQKNGKGEMALEWDLSFLRLYEKGEDNRSTIEEGIRVLERGFAQIPDVQLQDIGINNEGSQARLSFSFKTLNGLNQALTFVYLGDSAERYLFFEQQDQVIIRNQVPQLGQKVLERWSTVWRDSLEYKEKDNFRFETELELKSAIQLVYSPVNIEISPDQHKVSWNFVGKDLFSKKPKSIKILTD